MMVDLTTHIPVNNEDAESGWHARVFLAHKILLPAILIYIMLAMGCTISLSQLWAHLRHPHGAVIGAICQFVLMPLIGFGIAYVCQLPTSEALGLILMSCSPAGGMSNLFTYWVDGDVSLSICMTTISTTLALGMMPLNLFLYAKAWTYVFPPESAPQVLTRSGISNGSTTVNYEEEFVFTSETIPYTSIVITLVSTLGPVMVGIAIRRKWLNLAKTLAKLGSVAGLLAILAAMIMQAFLYKWYEVQEWQFWVAPCLLSLLGFILGGIFAWIFRLPFKLARTVGFETGSQNVSLAISVVILAFPKEQQGSIILVQILYGVFLPFTGGSLVALYFIWMRFHPKNNLPNPEQKDLDQDNISSGYVTSSHSETSINKNSQNVSMNTSTVTDNVSFTSSISGAKNVMVLSGSIEYITNV